MSVHFLYFFPIHTKIIRRYDWCPYGPLSFVVPLIASIACTLYLVAAYKCFTFVARGDDGGDGPYEIWVGYWGLEDRVVSAELGPGNDSNTCQGWSDPGIFDGAWRFGKALGPLGTFTNLALAMLDFFLLLIPLPQMWLFLMAIWHLLNGGMAGFLLYGLRSEICDGTVFSCKVGPGGLLAIFSCLLWLLDFFLCLCLRQREIALGGGGYLQRGGGQEEEEAEEYDHDAIEDGQDYEEQAPDSPRHKSKRAMIEDRTDDNESIPTSIKLVTVSNDDEDDGAHANSRALVHRKSETKRTDMPTTPRGSKRLLTQGNSNRSVGSSRGASGSNKPSQTVDALVSPRRIKSAGPKALAADGRNGGPRRSQSQRAGNSSSMSSPRPGRKTSKNFGHASLPAGLELDDGDTDIVSMAPSRASTARKSLPPPPMNGMR